MPRILVTGATGFIGLAVSAQLSAMDLQPALMVRRPERQALLKGLKADFVQAKLEDPQSLHEAVKGCEAVIHLGARASFERYTLLKPTIVDGSKAMMEAAVAAGVKTFIYASSLLLYASQDELIDQSTPAAPISDYGKAKLESEVMLSEMAAKAGMAFASLRIPHTYGVCDLMFEQVRGGRVILPGLCNNMYTHMHVADCATVLIEAARQGWSGISPIGDDRPASWKEFIAVIKELYPRFTPIRLPQELALTGTWLYTAARQLFTDNPSLMTPDAVRSWNLNTAVKPGLVREELGLKLRYPDIRDGIAEVIDAQMSFRWRHPLYCASESCGCIDEEKGKAGAGPAPLS